MFPKIVFPKTVLAACLGLMVLAVPPVRAQLGASDLPDLSGLAGAIEQSVKTPPAPPKGALYHSGLTVPSVHPGVTATDIARQMRVSVEAKTGPNPAMQKLEAAMPGVITALEAQMQKQGFAKRDLGVATGLFFVGNWETATKHSLSDPAENAVVRAVSSTATSKWKARFSTLSPAAKEKTYESLLASTALLSVFAQSFDKAGKTQEAASIRHTAGALFQKVVGTSPSEVTISAAGRITRAASVGPVKNTSKQASAAVPAARRGGGVKPSQIAGIYCQPTYGVGAGGFMSVSYEPVLALKDGTYCGGFEVPPSDLNVAASRQAHPRRWGRWRGSAKSTQTQNSKGVWEKSGWIGPLPAPPTHLSGTYTRVSGGGTVAAGGDAMVFVQNSYTFRPNGQFKSGSTASASTNSVTAGSSRKNSGTYQISGNAITMRFADGTAERWSYARTADGLVFLHGDAYVDEK